MTEAINTTGSTCPLIKGETFDGYHGFCQVCLKCPFDKCIDGRQVKKLTHAERGSLGGYVTSSRARRGYYGPDAKRRWGAKGGRSRLPTLEVVRQQQLLRAQYKKEGKDTPDKLPNNLKELRRLLRHRSNGSYQIQKKPGATSSLLASGGVSN